MSCVATLSGHKMEVTSCCVFSEQIFASVSPDNNVKLWDAASLSCIREKSICWLRSCSISAHGLIFLIPFDYDLKIYDQKTLTCVATLKGHNGVVRGCCVLENGNIITASQDGTLKLWNCVWRTADDE